MQADQMAQYLRRFVRVEDWQQTHWLSQLAPPAWEDEQGPVWRLSRIQRALGMIEISPKLNEQATLSADEVLMGGQAYACEFMGKGKLWGEPPATEAVSIWPTFDEPWTGSTLDAQAGRLEKLTVSAKRNSYPHPGRVEVMGLLNHVWIGGFELKLYVQSTQSFKYVRWLGDFPQLSVLNRFVYVVGQLDDAEGVLRFERAHVVTPIKAPKNWRELRQKAQNTPLSAQGDEEPEGFSHGPEEE